jgi:uncharacterized protein (DUF58 family)
MQGIICTIQDLFNLRYCSEMTNFHPHKKVAAQQHGDYSSPFRGKGMVFSETRVYQPGDDVRSIHWRVTAKTGKTHTKVFQQERERPVFIAIDLNPSMFFGTRVAFKSLVAAKVASLVAWSSIKTGDRVGGMIFNADEQILLKPRSQTHGVISLAKNLINFLKKMPQQEKVCEYHLALNKLRRILKPGSLIYFISDFYLLNKANTDVLKSLARSHEIINLFVYDKLEAEAPKENFYLFSDFSHQKSLLIDTYDKKICQTYTSFYEQRLQQLKKLQECGLKFVSMATDQDITTLLKHIQQVW